MAFVAPHTAGGARPRPLFPTPAPQLFRPYQRGVQPGAVIADRWGTVFAPAQPQPNTSAYPGDPSLDYVLGFLYAWLVLDGQASAPWQSAFGYPLIKSASSLLPFNPSERTFNSSYLPALYLWRDDQQGGKFEYLTEDWLVETSTWTLLWALPLGSQENQRARTNYANQFVKSVIIGIERGYTPSWVLPGDPDPQAASRGSFIGEWTNMVRMFVSSWKRSRIRVQMADGTPPQEFPAVEVKIDVKERQDRTIRRFAPLQYLDQRVLNQFGVPVEHEIDT